MVKKGSYEAAREANIARNNVLLCILGFPPSIMQVKKKAASMEPEKPLSAKKPRPCSAAKGQNPNPHRTPHPNLLPTHYPNPIPNPNPYPNPNPNPITDEGRKRRQWRRGHQQHAGPVEGPGKGGVTRLLHINLTLSLYRNPYSNPNPNRNP